MTNLVSDVAVIGAGVVGTAVARELAVRGCSVNIIEAKSDVGCGTSKANTAILHTGFDATPGSLESRLVRRGHDLLLNYATTSGIAVERTNALMVAWNDEQLAQFDVVVEKSLANGHHQIERIDGQEVARLEPHLSNLACGGLVINGEFIIDPWSVPIAFAREALGYGAVFTNKAEVLSVEVDREVTTLRTTAGPLRARFVVNAAGLAGAKVDEMFTGHRFTITPRRGELVVYDKLARKLVSHIILPVPQKHTKGVLVTPTVFGNLMVGPTADDIDDPTATGSTHDGVASVIAAAHRLVPELQDEEITAVYAGLRAATESSDYRLFTDPTLRYVCLGGIRSTGLSASMALAEETCEWLIACGLNVGAPTEFGTRIRMPPLGERQRRPADDGEACVCLCERVTASEVIGACAAPIGATTLDGLRRRTRALNGKCQGFYCLAEVCALASQTTAIPSEQWLAGTS
ncbi:MAG: NAD(P)/FAD-dependent oxidoreductase [Actinomycetota bacterium]